MGTYELTGRELKFAAEHMLLCKLRKKYRVLVEADTKSNGKLLCSDLQKVYKPSNIADYSGGYRDFSLVFNTKDRRNEVYNDILNAVSEYRGSHPDAMPQGVSTKYEYEEEDTDGDKTGDWTTYIVIGAALVLILILLWNPQKK